jgi:hypothetical protein
MFLGDDTVTADYYGPPRGGQSYSQYNSFMKIPYYSVGAGVATAMLVNPILGLGVGAAVWLLGGDSSHSNKPTQQGG